MPHDFGPFNLQTNNGAFSSETYDSDAILTEKVKYLGVIRIN